MLEYLPVILKGIEAIEGSLLKREALLLGR
jgi:hypothetical protein